jgi:DNA invertase Pin-like site-specific DNA recombinase
MNISHRPPSNKAFSYIRVSSDLQIKGDGLRRQLELSRKYADQHGLELVEDPKLWDPARSGYRGENIASGGLGRFLEGIRTGMVPRGSYLLVESIDRLSRQAPAKALQPFLEVIGAGIVLVTMNPLEVFTEENLDFPRLLMALTIMQRSHEESDIKSHRLRSVWANKRKNLATKKLTGRCPSWLQLTADRQEFEVVEEKAAIVRRIFDEAAAGLGTFSIVRRLNAEGIPTFTGKGAGWQNSTVNKILSGTAVIGTFQPSKMVNGKREPDGESITGYFPRIVPQALFERAQRGRLERKTKPEGEKRGSGGPKGKHFTNLFSKLAVCDYCGKPMHYQNKGKPPKGRSYLVCSSALGNEGCDRTGRWRYDQFEETFLKFVEQLDLASLVSSSEHTNKRNELAFELEAAEGKIKRLDEELRRTVETSMSAPLAEFSSDYLAERIRRTEIELAHTKQQAQQFRHELAVLDQTALTYYKKPDQVAQLIDRIRSSRGDDVYKLRAQIAARLQLLIRELRLTIDPDAQRFEVIFRDGFVMNLFVDPEDPTKFVQKVTGKSPNYELVKADGELVQLPADEETAEGF